MRTQKCNGLDPASTASRRLQRGFSLIELSVAMAIYSMGLGSLSLMMLLAVQGTSDARFETTAALETASLAEQIAVNSPAIDHYLVQPRADPALDCGFGEVCSVEEMAAWQLTTWNARLAAELPGGAGLVCRDSTPGDGSADAGGCDGSGGYVIKVFWRPSIDPAEPAAASDRRVMSLPLP